MLESEFKDKIVSDSPTNDFDDLPFGQSLIGSYEGEPLPEALSPNLLKSRRSFDENDDKIVSSFLAKRELNDECEDLKIDRDLFFFD